jgi:hypothetical protein
MNFDLSAEGRKRVVFSTLKEQHNSYNLLFSTTGFIKDDMVRPINKDLFSHLLVILQ